MPGPGYSDRGQNWFRCGGFQPWGSNQLRKISNKDIELTDKIRELRRVEENLNQRIHQMERELLERRQLESALRERSGYSGEALSEGDQGILHEAASHSRSCRDGTQNPGWKSDIG
ncbi:MAG: hypothetical protein DRH11_17850 [Deltaproteobacteria bacterium]|nr:MAG: hypothetical protein DRH11_17850 [Deltaproteobacteria bacterium]